MPQPTLTRAEMDAQLERLDRLRATCPACHGNPDICRAGDRDLNRLPGCAAFTPEGMVKITLRPVRQPWEAREQHAA